MTILRGEWEQLRERPTRVLRFLAAAIALALFIWFVSHITTGWFVGFATRAGIFAILVLALNVQWDTRGYSTSASSRFSWWARTSARS